MKDDQILPAYRSASSTPQSRTRPPPRILVVEDDIFIRQLNTVVLLRSGYAVDTAEDGAAAWEAIQAHRYDLMITDNNMPKLSGIELVKKLRDGDMILPVIMATGALPAMELDPKPQCHLTTLLLKPYTIVELMGKVKAVLAAVESARPETENCNRDDQRCLVGLGH